MKVFVDEEYGYRYWCWIPAHSDLDELVEWWETTMTAEYVDDFAFFDVTEIEGEWKELDRNTQPDLDSYDAHAHIHMSDDTSLVVNEHTYYVTDREVHDK